MNELPPTVRDLLRRGDPAHDVSPQVVSRVAARLATHPTRTGVGRPVVFVVVLLAGVAMGAGATVAVMKLAPGVMARLSAPARVTTATPPPPVNTALERETALLQGALEALHRHDTERALALLDERDRSFTPGALATESRVARVRVLLDRGQATEARQLLERLPASDVTPTLRLSLARALVERGECAAATQVAQPLERTLPEVVESTLVPCSKAQAPR